MEQQTARRACSIEHLTCLTGKSLFRVFLLTPTSPVSLCAPLTLSLTNTRVHQLHVPHSLGFIHLLRPRLCDVQGDDLLPHEA